MRARYGFRKGSRPRRARTLRAGSGSVAGAGAAEVTAVAVEDADVAVEKDASGMTKV